MVQLFAWHGSDGIAEYQPYSVGSMQSYGRYLTQASFTDAVHLDA